MPTRPVVYPCYCYVICDIMLYWTMLDNCAIWPILCPCTLNPNLLTYLLTGPCYNGTGLITVLSHEHGILNTSNLTVCVTAHSNGHHDHKKHHSCTLLAICEAKPPVNRRFLIQRASNMENISMSWCHHAILYRNSTDLVVLKCTMLQTQILQ